MITALKDDGKEFGVWEVSWPLKW